jgi:phosphonopyruvate decarboxylase
MIKPEEFIDFLIKNKTCFFSGVPDSTFKGLTTCFDAGSEKFIHLNASNECEAVGIGSGYHLSTGMIPAIYMQNSGLGKIVNPYTSMAAKEVYSIPLLFLVGWRGEPGKKDEPQHKLMGRITGKLLETLEIKYEILDESLWKEQLATALKYCKENNRPYALIIKKGTFSSADTVNQKKTSDFMLREEILKIILKTAPKNALFISTTGKTSREIFEIRENSETSHENDFYTVGSMGCASSIALGVSYGHHKKPVFIVDGDGAALMQAGTFAALGNHGKNKDITHILIDNGVHESTGAQKTLSNTVSFEGIAKNCGYKTVASATTKEEIVNSLSDFRKLSGLKLLVIKSSSGSRPDLGRPTTTPIENKNNFMKAIQNG